MRQGIRLRTCSNRAHGYSISYCLGYSAGLHIGFLVALWLTPGAPQPLRPPTQADIQVVTIWDGEPMETKVAVGH